MEWLDNIETGADRMKKLIQNLISLVKIEGSDSDVIKTSVQLKDEIKERLSAFHLMIEDKRLQVEECYYGSDVGNIVSDPDRVRQVINILLDNAIKYTEVGGTIQVILTREKKWTCLSVLNTCPGIARENLGKVFDRFYREESARSHDGSHGLGLAIAAEAMRQLGGTISVDSVVNENTVFTVRYSGGRIIKP
jgi:signal transduction histidine kinase